MLDVNIHASCLVIYRHYGTIKGDTFLTYA